MRKRLVVLICGLAVLGVLTVPLYRALPWLELAYLEARIDWNCSQAKPDQACLERMRAMGHVWSGMANLERAKRWYAAAAAHGDAAAMFHLGWVYDVEARQEIREFALTSAQRMQAAAPAAAGGAPVPEMATETASVAAKVAQASEWYHRAANLGFAPAMNNLGQLYYIGLDRGESLDVAFEWYMQAARAGNPAGAWNVMLAYARGLGVRTNFAEMKRWAVWSSEYTEAADLAWPTLERTEVLGSFMAPGTVAVVRSASVAGVKLQFDKMAPPYLAPLPRVSAASSRG